ncbi:Ribulose bisphosphate carboxylase small chain [Hirschfeldia incana]|nr:Ribulose bisphosphate carboxylase small chain [Hirschfeldia incana]
MASSMLSSATIVSSPAQATMGAPFTGLKSSSAFPVIHKTNADITSITSNGGRVNCMQVWPPIGKKKFETLSYLPDLTDVKLAKEVEYLIRNKWTPCVEFELEHGFVYHQVLKEVQECKKEYPNAFIRIIGFDNKRQTQCISFIAYKPPSFTGV